MSLTDPSTIDLVTRVPSRPDQVALVISDDGTLADAEAREAALRQKLTTYLSFVASGELIRAYPDLAGLRPFVYVVCVTAPTPGIKAIDAVRTRTHPPCELRVEVGTKAEFLAAMAPSRHGGAPVLPPRS